MSSKKIIAARHGIKAGAGTAMKSQSERRKVKKVPESERTKYDTKQPEPNLGRKAKEVGLKAKEVWLKAKEKAATTPKQKITIYLSLVNVQAGFTFCELELQVWPAAV